jgi:hypothetical protein
LIQALEGAQSLAPWIAEETLLGAGLIEEKGSHGGHGVAQQILRCLWILG